MLRRRGGMCISVRLRLCWRCATVTASGIGTELVVGDGKARLALVLSGRAAGYLGDSARMLSHGWWVLDVVRPASTQDALHRREGAPWHVERRVVSFPLTCLEGISRDSVPLHRRL